MTSWTERGEERSCIRKTPASREAFYTEWGGRLVPVLFGGGTRMFDDSLDDHIDLEPVEVIETPVAIHQRFRVVGRGTAANA